MGDLEFCEEPQSGDKGMHCWEVLTIGIMIGITVAFLYRFTVPRL